MPTTVKLANHLFLGKSLGSKGEPATATLLSQDNFYCLLSTYLSFYAQMYFSLLIKEVTQKTTAGPNAENNERWCTTTADTSTT